MSGTAGKNVFFLYWHGILGHCQYYSASSVLLYWKWQNITVISPVFWFTICLTVDITTHYVKSIRITWDQISANSCSGFYCSKPYSACSGISPGQKWSILSFFSISGLAMVSNLGELSGSWCKAKSSLEPFAPALRAVSQEQNWQLHYFQNLNVILTWFQKKWQKNNGNRNHPRSFA